MKLRIKKVRFNEENFNLMVESLNKIASFDVEKEYDYVDEWNEAQAFNRCKEIAENAFKQIK